MKEAVLYHPSFHILLPDKFEIRQQVVAIKKHTAINYKI